MQRPSEPLTVSADARLRSRIDRAQPVGKSMNCHPTGWRDATMNSQKA